MGGVNCAAADTPGGIRMDHGRWAGKASLRREGSQRDELAGHRIIGLGERPTFFKIPDQDQRQVANTDVDVFQPYVEGVLEEGTDLRTDQTVVQTTQPGDIEFSNPDIDVFDASTITRAIQPEVILRILIEPVVETFASPA